MNKILVLGIQDCNSHYYIKCAFTFNKLLKNNAQYNSEWLTELTDYAITKSVFRLEDYIKWNKQSNNLSDDISTSENNKVVYKQTPQDKEFFDSNKILYTLNDYKCVDYISSFDRCTKYTRTVMEPYKVSAAIYHNGVYIFNEPIRKNSITDGAIQYLKELKSKEYTETLDILIWLYNLTDTLKTLIRWYY